MNQELIGQIAGVIVLASIVPYLISIFRGETKPARTTYFIKSVICLLTLASYYAVGARSSIWTTVVYAATAILIFALSLWRGIGGKSVWDLVSLCLAFGGILVWVTTHDAVLTLYASLFIKTVAEIPLVIKTYQYPATENLTSWILALVGDGLNMFALTSLAPDSALLPLWEVASSLLIVWIILSRRSTRPATAHR